MGKTQSSLDSSLSKVLLLDWALKQQQQQKVILCSFRRRKKLWFLWNQFVQNHSGWASDLFSGLCMGIQLIFQKNDKCEVSAMCNVHCTMCIVHIVHCAWVSWNTEVAWLAKVECENMWIQVKTRIYIYEHVHFMKLCDIYKKKWKHGMICKTCEICEPSIKKNILV